MSLFHSARSRRWLAGLGAIILLAPLGACAEDRPRTSVSGDRHYVSGAGGPPPIDVGAVEKAFWATQNQDFSAWMQAFEQRVNELYDGNGVVSLDARQNERKFLNVTGFLEKNDQAGYQADKDKRLFSIEQTDPVRDNRMGYRMGGYDGGYYHGSHGISGGSFMTAMLLSHFLSRPYYTPQERIVVLQDHRHRYRATPDYNDARRDRLRQFGATQSSRRFGTSTTSNAPKKRSWLGWGTSGGSSSRSSSWSQRRSSGGWGSGNSSSSRRSSGRSWGGRRR